MNNWRDSILEKILGEKTSTKSLSMDTTINLLGGEKRARTGNLLGRKNREKKIFLGVKPKVKIRVWIGKKLERSSGRLEFEISKHRGSDLLEGVLTNVDLTKSLASFGGNFENERIHAISF